MGHVDRAKERVTKLRRLRALMADGRSFTAAEESIRDEFGSGFGARLNEVFKDEQKVEEYIARCETDVRRFEYVEQLLVKGESTTKVVRLVKEKFGMLMSTETIGKMRESPHANRSVDGRSIPKSGTLERRAFYVEQIEQGASVKGAMAATRKRFGKGVGTKWAWELRRKARSAAMEKLATEQQPPCIGPAIEIPQPPHNDLKTAARGLLQAMRQEGVQRLSIDDQGRIEITKTSIGQIDE